MKSNEIRSSFLEYFRSKGHTIVPSSPLVPQNDPTLLFVNSGMVQFKDVFLGKDKRAYTRATTSQRSRARRRQAQRPRERRLHRAPPHVLRDAGQLLLRRLLQEGRDPVRLGAAHQGLRLAPDRLWTTVYETDDEAFDLWTKMIGVPPERCVRIGDKPGGPKYQSDNFWQMADTGPCGPCSEIFYDHGPGVAGGPPGSPDADGDRYIEIWNLVFMQFNRDDKGVMHPLPKPSVDTGMGLERIAAVLQGKHSNYEIDLFQDLIKAAARETAQKDLKNPSLNVIADHIRACSFLIVDGVIPGNEGRGYVLRRIIRRAIRHGYKLGQKQPFFHRLVADLDKAMGDAYPELRKARERVADTLKTEEEQFAETLENGMKLFAAGARTEERVIGYIRDHFVHDFQSYEPRNNALCEGVFHKANEDVLVGAKSAGSVPNVDTLVNKLVSEVEKYSKEQGKPARMYLVLHGKSDKTPEELLDNVGRARTTTPSGCSTSRSRRFRSTGAPPSRSTTPTVFPFDLTQDLCREKGIPVDVSAFDTAMQEQREQGARGVEVRHGGGAGIRRREDRVPRLRGAEPCRPRWWRCTARARGSRR